LTTLNGQMFNSKLYKNALVKQNIYGRLPEIVGAAITSSTAYDPCAQNQLACSMDGASPELQTCLTTALGSAAYKSIGSSARLPTSLELQLAQPCLERYGSAQNANPQPGAGESGMPFFLKNLTTTDWQAILTILLPPETLKTMTESSLDQVFAYLNGEVDSVSVPLAIFKDRLLGPAGKDLFMQLLNSLQPCNEQDLSQLILGMSNGGTVLCKPPEDMISIITALVPDLLNSIVPMIPDKAFIIKAPAPGAQLPGSGRFGADPVSTVRTIRLVMRLSFLVPLFFLLLVTLFAVRSYPSWMRWWGIPFFFTGIIGLGLGLSIVPAFNATWTWLIAPRIPVFLPAVLPQTGVEVFRSIIQTLSGWIIAPAVILSIMGLGAWIGSSYIKKNSEHDFPEAASIPTS
ncbi:MAG: hypothetical protein ACXWNC_04130, partial [Anaerolineales bacterium]